jgi:1,4-alpha-glucan branching enzyme
MSEGYLALVLHTHLPFVKHPEHDRPLEERWLHEALIECYLPLLDVFERLRRDGVPFALTMSLTPPLAAMLSDELLCRRFEEHLEHLITLCAHEVERTGDDPYFGPIALFYRQRLEQMKAVWQGCGGKVVGALAAHHATGQLELITCSATHAYLPGLLSCPGALRAQLRLGAAAFHHLVGHRPLGIWLPECAYDPSFDGEIAAAGLRFTLVDAHGLRNARPRPPFDIHHPVVSSSGVAFFARDQHSSEQVWSREGGYPGNPYYRDFYRDIGYDLPEEQLHGEVGPFNSRVMTGLKYHRITGKTDKKLPYMPGVAEDCARTDALDFVRNRTGHADRLASMMPVPPVIVAPYDSELFGHWWFEGPRFLEWVFRHVHANRPHAIQPITLRGYLDRFPTALRTTPAASSWGAGGHGEVWVGPAAAPYWRHVHHASHRVEHLVRRHQDAAGPRGEALDLVIRELLLLQTSDWPFILSTATTVEYAEARLRAHAARVRRLCAMIESASMADGDITWMRELDQRDSFLSGLSGHTLRGAFLDEFFTS